MNHEPHEDADPAASSPRWPGSLTARERSVAAMLAHGFSRREIAAGLSIDEKTVDTYRKNVLNKLGIRDAVHLARWAVRSGLVSLDEQEDAEAMLDAGRVFANVEGSG